MEASLKSGLLEVSAENFDYVVVKNGVYINELIDHLSIKLKELNTATRILMKNLSNEDLWGWRCREE